MTAWLKSTGFTRPTAPVMALTMDIPQVTEVIAKNRIIEMTAIETDTVFTLAASWRIVNMLSPRQ